PNTNITVVHRSDSSGSTLLWTGYLAHSSDLWRSEVGVSLTPKWPTGVGGFGNAGVASSVQRTRFAIGYADYFYVRQHRLSDVS
ncbi:substrate-binding domain-containing protein, partial [Mycobacterium tuberculosis]|nr:substrate-binding domain-containing protein [Mycobacterium tuberculosis]